MKKTGKDLQQVDDEARSVTGKTSSTDSEKQQKNSNDIGARLEIVTVDDHTGEASQVPTAATPILRISNPGVAKIIKDSRTTMLMNTTPKITAPLVTLNTSVHEIPSQTTESFGEQATDSGQQLLSSGNNQQVDKGMVSISQASTNEVSAYNEKQGVTSAAMINGKTWADQVEEDDEDNVFNFQEASNDEADYGSKSYSSNKKAVEVYEQASNFSNSWPSKRELSPNAPVYVPTGQQQISAVGLKDRSNIKALSTGKVASTGSPIGRYNLTPTNILQALEDPGKALATTSKPIGIMAKTHEQGYTILLKHLVRIWVKFFMKGKRKNF